jgi:cytochrome c-type biogenesis protein CcmF
VLYSTFLTRSGVLGETSVHAFTEMGLETQLLLFIFTFSLLALGLMLARRKEIPSPEQEEALSSKEFWMFIGTLVLLFSAVIITASTSLPVYNQIVRIFNPDFTGMTITDPVTHYNKYQLWIGVFVGLLTGLVQFLRFRESNWGSHVRNFAKHTGIAAALAILLTIATSFWIQLGPVQYWLLMFAGLFGMTANLDYIFFFLRGNLKVAGSALSHVGFGIMIAGVIASGLNKQNISNNPMAQAGLLDEEMLQKNVLLFKKTPMYMSGYRVTFEGDTLVGNLRTFVVNYEKLDANGNVVEQFQVKPQAIYDNKVVEVKAYNPSTKRYFGKDIFTHIATLPMKEANFKVAHEQEDSLKYQTYLIGETPVTVLDTVETGNNKTTVLETKVSVLSINRQPANPDYKPEPGDFAVGVKLAFEKEDTTFTAEPMVYLRGQLWGSYPVQMNDLSMKIRLPEEALVQLLDEENKQEYKKFTFQTGDSVILNGRKILFAGINKKPDIQLKEGDVAVSATLSIEDPAHPQPFIAEPVFLIRDNKFLTPGSDVPELGLSFFLAKINPDTETFEVMVAQRDPDSVRPIPVQIAKKSYRTDYIVLEAIVFPGINLFWLGSTLMMIGLAVAMFRRWKEKPISKAA